MSPHSQSKGEFISRKQRGGRTLKSTKNARSAAEVHGTIEMEIFAARNLAKADLLGLSDPYTIVQTTTGPARYKTKIVKNTLNPTWNEKYGIGTSLVRRMLAQHPHNAHI